MGSLSEFDFYEFIEEAYSTPLVMSEYVESLVIKKLKGISILIVEPKETLLKGSGQEEFDYFEGWSIGGTQTIFGVSKEEGYSLIIQYDGRDLNVQSLCYILLNLNKVTSWKEND